MIEAIDETSNGIVCTGACVELDAPDHLEFDGFGAK
jgi:hypothetical protein